MPDLDMRSVTVTFDGLSSPVLSIDAFSLRKGEHLVITGASGSGKSTFVNVVTGLEKLSSGSIRWGSTALETLSESRRDRWRGKTVGLVMQDFHLFEGLSALDNVLLPARLSRAADAATVKRAHALLDTVGLARPGQRVETMSRGEMQRVAVARALVRRPAVIVADEPTASLDEESGRQVADLLLTLAEREKSTLIVVSHDRTLINRFERRIHLARGVIVEAIEEAAA
jgi:putative ABC transport system ATP-binding protein